MTGLINTHSFSMKYLIVGLGNIGPEYELTRHNIGFLTLDRLADKEGAAWKSDRLAFKTEIKHKARTLHLIKPTTYMNLSGKAVNYWMKELNIPKENILVLVDDVAIPFAKLRMRAKGSAAGHNGLKNIEALCGGQEGAGRNEFAVVVAQADQQFGVQALVRGMLAKRGDALRVQHEAVFVDGLLQPAGPLHFRHS